ncbi:hypothetical protein ACIJDX_000136 [Enterococcus faecalis]
MHELIKEIERQLEMDRIEEGNMSAEDVLYIVKGFKRPYLNENQQIVLDWLKVATTDNYKNPVLEGLFAVVGMVNDLHPHFDPEICKAYEALILEQEAQVLEVFAKWALEQEEL